LKTVFFRSNENDYLAKLLRKQNESQKKKKPKEKSGENDAQMEEYDALLKSLFERDEKEGKKKVFKRNMD